MKAHVIFLLLSLIFFLSQLVTSQTEGFNYKALITENGNPLSNQDVTVRFSLIQDSENYTESNDAKTTIATLANKYLAVGDEIYVETINATTDANGIVSVVIGSGNPVSGDFSSINWNQEISLKVEIDAGKGYLDYGTNPFHYVPYAKYASVAGNVFSGNYNDLSNTPVFFYKTGTTNVPYNISDNIYRIGGFVIGDNENNALLPGNKIYLKDSVTNTSSSAINTYLIGNGPGDHYSLYNLIIGEGNGAQYGIKTLISNSGNSSHFGYYSELSGEGAGDHIGIFNHLKGVGEGPQYGNYNYIDNSNSEVHYGVFNEIGGSGSGAQYGMRNYITNSGNGVHYGTYNYINSKGAGGQYGSYNKISGDGNGTQYGIKTLISNSGNSSHFGYYSELSGEGAGNHIGIFNHLKGVGEGPQYGNYNYIDNSNSEVHYGVFNEIGGSGSGTQYGIRNYITNSGNGVHYGIYNYINSKGKGEQYGSYNKILGDGDGAKYGTKSLISNSGYGTNYGFYSEFDGTGVGSRVGLFNNMSKNSGGPKYGVYNFINSSNNDNVMGVYTEINGDGTIDQFGMKNDIRNSSGADLYGTYNYIKGKGENSSHYASYNKIDGSSEGSNVAVYGEAIPEDEDNYKYYAGLFYGKVYISGDLRATRITKYTYPGILGNADVTAYIYGSIKASDGTAYPDESTKGFSTEHPATGVYKIKFQETFGNKSYLVIANALNASSPVILTYEKGFGYFYIRAWNLSGKLVDTYFNFVVIKK